MNAVHGRDDEDGTQPTGPRPSRMKKALTTVGVGLIRTVIGQMITLLLHQWWAG